MGNGKVEFKIEVMSNNTINLTDADGNTLEPIDDSKELLNHLNKPIKNAVVTPMYTYFKTNSGVIIINGRAYRVP
jgi:hypothetical protein